MHLLRGQAPPAAPLWGQGPGDPGSPARDQTGAHQNLSRKGCEQSGCRCVAGVSALEGRLPPNLDRSLSSVGGALSTKGSFPEAPGGGDKGGRRISEVPRLFQPEWLLKTGREAQGSTAERGSCWVGLGSDLVARPSVVGARRPHRRRRPAGGTHGACVWGGPMGLVWEAGPWAVGALCIPGRRVSWGQRTWALELGGWGFHVTCKQL